MNDNCNNIGGCVLLAILLIITLVLIICIILHNKLWLLGIFLIFAFILGYLSSRSN